MKYIAAYVLLVLGGKLSPSLEDVTEVLTAVGAQVDVQQLSLLISDLHGKDIHELLASGSKAIDDASCRTLVSAPTSTTPRIRKSVFLCFAADRKHTNLCLIANYLDIFGHDCHSEPDEDFFDSL